MRQGNKLDYHAQTNRYNFAAHHPTNLKWTLSAMTLKNKNGGDSWGTLYGRPMERLAFCYDRHEEIARYFGCGMYTIIQW